MAAVLEDKAAVIWGQGCCYLGTRLLLFGDKAAVFEDKALGTRLLLFGDKVAVLGDKATVI